MDEKTRLVLILVITISCNLLFTDGAHLGCFKEQLRRRNFAKNPGALKVSDVTPVSCYTRCGALGYTYAGLGNGYQCFCSNTNPNVMAKEDSKCTIQCTGDSSQTCGSVTHISVYDAIAPISVSVSASSKVVATGSSVTLSPAVSNAAGTVSSYDLRLDYNDGSYISDYQNNGNGLRSRTYYLAGEYAIKTYANNQEQSLADVETQTGVLVHTPVSDLNLTCPSTMATHEPDECSLQVNRGTDMSVTFSYTDGGSISKTFTIADAVEASFGNPPMAKLDISNGTFTETLISSGVYILNGNNAQYTGKLSGIEYVAVTSGSVKFGIYAPVCSDYCYKENTCGSCTTDTCSAVPFCTDIESCCDTTPVRLQPPTYVLTPMKEKTLSVTAGFHYFDLTGENFQVLPGYTLVLEVQSGSNHIAVITDSRVGNSSDMYCDGVGIDTSNINLNTQCTEASNTVHQIQAIYTGTSEAKLPLEFLNSGSVSINAVVSNRQISGSATASASILVLEGVNYAIFDLPTCLESHVEITLQLLPFTGTDVNVYWTFGDGAHETVTTAPFTEVKHQYTSTGQYSLSVNISNTLSFKHNSTTVCVQRRISGVSYNIPQAATGIVKIGADLVSTIAMTTGSDYTCVITFAYSDGSSSQSTVTHLTGPNLIVSFSIPGTMTVTTVCSNSINDETHSQTLMAMEEITGVGLAQAGAIVNHPFLITVNWATGSGVTLSVTYDTTPLNMTLYDSDRRSISDELPADGVSIHTVHVTIGNDLGSLSESLTFTIDEEAFGINITCAFQNQLTTSQPSAYTVIGVGSYVSCTALVASGTNIEFQVNWDDGATPVYSASTSLASSWSHTTQNIFSSPKTSNITATVKNALTTTTEYIPVLVTEGVDGIFLNEVSYVVFTPGADVVFTWNTSAASSIPIGVTCEMYWGDRNNNTYTDCNLTQPLPYTYYDEAGNLNLTYTLSNVVNSVSGWILVEVITPIVDMKCFTRPTAFSPGVYGEIVVTFARAPGPRVLDLDFDCDTSVPGTDLSTKRQYESPSGEDTFNCSFSSPGTYTYSITATSVLETQTCTHSLKVLYPVTEQFDVLTNAPVDFDFTNNCTLDYLVNYTGNPLPDDAYIIIDYGDGNTHGPVSFANMYSVTHEYLGPGHYTTNLTIYNDATTVTRLLNSGCYEKFKNLSMTVLRKPFLPLDIEDQVPLGDSNDMFLATDVVKIHTNMSAGTLVWWEVTAISDNTSLSCNYTDDNSILSLNLTQVGTYNLSVLPNNVLFSGPLLSKNIRVVSPVENIAISDLGITTSVNQSKAFQISMEKYGTEMCVKVTNGYSSSPRFFGNQTTCSQSVDYLPSNYEGSVDVSQVFTIHEIYYQTGTFNLTVEAWTVYSESLKVFQFAVSDIPCSLPTPRIKQSRTFLYPLPKLRSVRIKLVGINNINCDYGLQNSKLWTLAAWDKNNNTKLYDVDITHIPSHNHSELSIDPLGLEYGVYRFTYKITMDAGNSGEEFSGSDETFVEVIPSDLVVQITDKQMSQWTVGPAVLLTLAPLVYSHDPDSDTSLGMDPRLETFAMSCRDVTNKSETFELPSTNNTITAYNLTDLPPGLNQGGCFQQDSGWFENFDGILLFNTSVLQPGHTYEFFVNGTRNTTRFSNGTIRIKVLHADPPDFTIDFKIQSIFHQHPQGKSFNPNSQLGLVANVTLECFGCNFTHLWRMFAHDHDYCFLNPDEGCWRELATLPIYIEGVESEELTVKTTVFEHYSSISQFQVRHMVTDPIRSVTGEVYLNLFRNTPPHSGQCTVSPTSGIVFKDKFTIRCEGFVDDDQEIASYRIRCGNENVAGGLHNGESFIEWTNKTLPVGDANNNYSLSCQVTVTDSWNSAGTYDMDPVTVLPMQATNIRDLMGVLRNQTADQADVVEANANLDDTCGFVSTISALIYTTSRDDEFSEYSSIGVAVTYRRTQFDETDPRNNAFTEVETNKTKKLEYESYRDNVATVLSQVSSTLEKCTVESAEEAILLTKTIETLSKAEEFIVRASQASLTNLIKQGVDTVKRNIDSNTATVEDVEAVGASAVGACGNIQEAATLSANHPTNTDLYTQSDPVQNFDSNYASDLDDVGDFENDYEALRDGMKIYNKQEQKSFISDNLAACENIKTEIVSLLVQIKPKSDIATEFNTDRVQMKILKNDASFFDRASFQTDAGAISLSSGILDDLNSDDTVVCTVTGQASSGEVDEDTPVSTMSSKLSVSFKFTDGTVKPVQNLKNPVTLGIKQDANQATSSFDDLEYADPEMHDSYLFYHQVTITQKNSAIKVTFRPTNISSTNQLLVLINFGEMPDLDFHRTKVRKACMIPSHTSFAGNYGGSGAVDPYSCFIQSVGDDVGIWYIGVRQLIITELNIYYSMEYLPRSPDKWRTYINFTQNYKIRSAQISCVYQEDGSNTIKYDGVQVSELSSESEIICESYHLTTFTGGWAVAPNTIDWNFVFSNADFLKNPTLYITEILILILYILAMIWARRKDKQDITKLGLAPLLDNDPRDKYYYEIMVNTGMRRNGGTESKVHFILSGEEDETDVRTFTDKKRKIMCRGNTDGFLMAVSSSLGALNYLRIWHDNSGQGKMASWYLNYIVIRDVQTDKKYYFIANRWFAVEEDDGQVDRVIPVAGKEQMTEFSHLFAERASKNLSDGHLWFSVVARPPQSRFTRCQRVSCCLCLLYVSMLANAMFYELATSDSSAFQFGPFALSLEQIYVGVICNIIIFPVNFLIMTLFRKSRPRKLRPSRVEEALKSSPQRTTSMTDVNPRVKSSMEVDRPGSSFLMDAKRSETSMSRPESSMSVVAARVEVNKGKKKCQLPWWCVIIAWILLFLVVLVSAAIVTAYGIQFQDTKCRKWITSLLISFFTSIFFTQPIKVFLFAIIFSLIIRKPENDQDEDDDEEPRKQLEADEEFLFKEEEDYSLVGPQRPLYKPKPPNAKVLEAARQQRLKEIQMWSVIREIVIYAFFLWILMVISYRSVSSNSYNYKQNMEKVFITTNDTKHAFSKVKNVQDFWVWAKTGMLRGLRAGPYYNNYPPFYLRGYINDKVSRLMGHAVLRQLRIQPGSCKIPSQVESIIDECNAPYEIPLEESRSFGPNWTDIGSSNGTREEYMYQDANSLDGYPYWGNTGVLYSGGGYVYRLNRDYFTMLSDMDRLESEKWIDEYTRAVFLEFTVYNPSINLFAISTLLSEFRPSGGVVPTYRFEPCTLLPYNSGVLVFQIICEIVYLIFTVSFVIKELRNLYKQKLKYFYQFWNIIEFSICAMSVSATVIYFYRLVCINELSSYFNETNGNGYMKFQYVGYWSELFNYMIGFLVFFASLKFLKLLRFNKRISLLADTLKNSAKDLIHFSIIFNIVFMAFVQVFYLVYHSNLDIFKTFMSSCEAGIVMMMGKFDIYNMSKVNQWFTQIFLFLFVVTITFIVVNMFLSILNDTFGNVRGNLAKQQNDYEIVDFMMNRFKVWTGMGKNNSATISPAEMEAERARNYQTLEGQIDYFPNQIDRFLASISHMYMEKSKFDDFLQQGAYGKMMMKARAQNQPYAPHPAPNHPGTLRLSSGARGMTDVQTD